MPNLLTLTSGTPLSIGSVTFANIEHPEELPISFKQTTVKHELIGGGKVIQTFGTQPQDISWTGNLFDSSVADRVRELSRLLADGRSVSLSYNEYRFDVIVTDFKATFYHEYWAKYEMTTEVIRDKCGLTSTSSATTLDSQTNALLSQALINQQNVPVPPIDPSLLANIQIQTSSIASLAAASQSDLQPILSNVNTALSGYQSFIAQLELVAPSVMTSSTFQQIGSVAKIINALTIVAKNLQNGQAPLTVPLMGGNLMQLAAQYYGDASQYTLLKEANNLTSFRLPTGVITNLVIPPGKNTNAIA